jgi:hypothetical protein
MILSHISQYTYTAVALDAILNQWHCRCLRDNTYMQVVVQYTFFFKYDECMINSRYIPFYLIQHHLNLQLCLLQALA